MSETYILGEREEPEPRFPKLRAKLRNWLGVETIPKDNDRLSKELHTTIDKLESELTFWKNTFRKYSRVPCAYCTKQMHVYPFGGAYYTHHGKKVHAACYDAYLEQESKKK